MSAAEEEMKREEREDIGRFIESFKSWCKMLGGNVIERRSGPERTYHYFVGCRLPKPVDVKSLCIARGVADKNATLNIDVEVSPEELSFRGLVRVSSDTYVITEFRDRETDQSFVSKRIFDRRASGFSIEGFCVSTRQVRGVKLDEMNIVIRFSEDRPALIHVEMKGSLKQ